MSVGMITFRFFISESKTNIDIYCSIGTTCADPVDSGLSVYLLMFGNFLCGFSGSMILTVGVSFIDDSLPATTSPLYIGTIFFLLHVTLTSLVVPS